jgi:hypothetical protein
MADTTVTVRQDGAGDYTTIASAEAAADISSGYYKIVIDDSNSYDESLTLNVPGTATSSNYLWLTVSEGNRHSGVAATSGHARLAPGGLEALQIIEWYARVEYLEIYTPSNKTAVRLNGNHALLSRCIIHTAGASNSYGIYSYSSSAPNVFVDNCLIYMFAHGIYGQNWVSSADTRNFYIDHCTIVDNAYSTSTNRTNLVYLLSQSGSMTSNFYNNAMAGSNVQDIHVSGTYSSLLSHTGSHNAWDTNTTYFASSTGSYTDSQDISSGGLTTTTTTANAMIVTDMTGGSEDYTPVVATGAGSNLLLTNGTNRQGSEPDPRQDFSTDIAGNKRPSKAGFIDIGAFQITQAPAAFKYWDGSAWADSTAVQYYNGSAWVDVTGIQYWNGSAWTDPS